MASPPYSFEQDGVTQSLLTTYLECRQKAKLNLERLTPRRASTPLRYGTLMHACLQRVFEAERLGKKYDVQKVVAEAEKDYRKNFAKGLRAQEEEDLELNLLQIQVVLTEYLAYWKEKKGLLRWIEIEGDFRVPFKLSDGRSTWLRGRFDGVFRAKDGGLWLLDNKNKSRIDEDAHGDVLLRDFQINFYLLALQKVTQKMPNGFLLNILRRPGLELKKKENLPQYGARLGKDIALRPDHYFKRYEVAVDQGDLADFEKELDGLLREFGDWSKARPVRLFGMPCVNKYGLCHFVQHCYNGNKAAYFQRKELYAELEN